MAEQSNLTTSPRVADGNGRIFTWTDLTLIGVVALIQAIFLFYLMKDAAVSLLWDSESYFETARRFQNHFPYLPKLNFRAFGYPGFLRLFMKGHEFNLFAVVFAQKLLTLGSTVLVYALARLVAQARGLAFAAAALFALNPEIALFSNSVMTETLSIFLELLALLLAVLCLRRNADLIGLAGTATILLLAIVVRPTFVVAMPVILLAVAWLNWRSATSLVGFAKAYLSRVLLVGLIAIGPVVAYAGYNLYKMGYFKAFMGAGFSSLNYVTNPCFYQKFSVRLDYVRDTLLTLQQTVAPEYQDAAISDPRCHAWFFPTERPDKLHWGIAFDSLKAAFEKKYPDLHMEWDTLALRISMAAISDQPVEYLRIWTQVFTDFWTTYAQGFGLYATVDDLNAGHTVLSGTISESILNNIGEFYRTLSQFSFVILIAAFMNAFSTGASGRVAALATFMLCVYAIVYSLLSTGLEPGGQRYRVVLDPIVYICAARLVSWIDWFVRRIRHLKDSLVGAAALR